MGADVSSHSEFPVPKVGLGPGGRVSIGGRLVGRGGRVPPTGGKVPPGGSSPPVVVVVGPNVGGAVGGSVGS